MAFGREDVIVRFGGDASGLNREMGNLERGVSKLRSAFATIGTAIGVGALGRQLAEAATNIDKFRRGFEQIAGSSRSARAEMQYVSESANRMGIGLDTAREAYLSLTAAAKGTALEGEQARRIFEAVGGAMAKLGRSGDDARGALLAIEQMISKGTVSAEELRGQLGERLPGAFQAAARAMGVTTEELGKLLQTGQITAEEMLPKLAAELENLYGTASRAESLAASWTRFQNALQQMMGGGQQQPMA